MAKLARAALLATFAVIAIRAGCFRGGYYGISGHYARLRIDPVTYETRVEGYVGLSSASRSYFRFTDPDGSHGISDCSPVGDPAHTCYAYLAVDRHNRLQLRKSTLRLLHASFGSVLTDVAYYYGERYRGQPNTLLTHSYFRTPSEVAPESLRAAPRLDTLPYDGASLVRVFHVPPVHVIVSANYRDEGALSAFTVDVTRGGAWLHSNEARQILGDSVLPATHLGAAPPALFGLPASFRSGNYLSSPHSPFGTAALSPVVDLVHLHYDNSHTVRQDTYTPGSAMTSTFLRYPMTWADSVLAPVDRARGFGRPSPRLDVQSAGGARVP